MTISVTHQKVATLPDEPGAEVNAAEWNQTHTVTGAAPLDSPTFTGVPAGPTAAPATNSTQLATTAYADAIAALKANLASPTFTGTATSPVYTATTKFLMPDGTAGAPSIGFASDDDGTGTGIFRQAANTLSFSYNGTERIRTSSNGLGLGIPLIISTAPSTNDNVVQSAGSNAMSFGASTLTTTARTELNKAVASIADAAATAVLTITVPNAAHSASLKLRLTGSLGAGGAIGANEATAAIEYDIAIARTAGVNAVAAISAAYGSAAVAVAGAATVTCTAAMSAVSGAVGASNTFTVNVTITRSGGASTNHTCLVYAQLMNANATGVTIA